MEQGYDRVAAATFAWTSTAFPMLTGTLVTAAGFLPVGFAKSTAGEYAGGIFWVVGHRPDRLVARGRGVHAVPRREAAPGGEGRPRPAARSPRPSTTRGCTAPCAALIAWCVRHPLGRRRWPRVGLFAGRCRRLPVRPAAVLPAVVAPRSCSSRSACPKGRRSRRPRRRCAKVEAGAQGDPEVDDFTTYTGGGSPRFFLALNPDLPNPSFAVVVHDDRRRPRPASASSSRLEAASLATAGSPRRACGSSRLDVRAAGRLPGPVPGDRPGRAKVRAHRPDRPRRMRRQEPDRATPARLGRAWRSRPARGRSGPRPGARADAAGRVGETLQTLLSGFTGHRDTAKASSWSTWSPGRCRRSGSKLDRLPDLTIPSVTGTPSRCRRSRGSTTSRRSRSSGGATARPSSPCGPTWPTACSRPT